MKCNTMRRKVLDRRKKRIVKRAEIAVKTFLFLLVATSAVFSAYHFKHKDDLIISNTWQGFGMSGAGSKGEWYEYVSKENEDGIPLTLYISGQRWDIIKVNHFKDATQEDGEPRSDGDFFGVQAQTNCAHRVISYIQTDDLRILRTNLMHEVFHAGRCLHNDGDAWWNSPQNPKNSNDHIGVYHLGEFMYSFSHDNPEFMKWESR